MQRIRRILATAVLMATSVVSVMPAQAALAADAPSTPDAPVVGTVTSTTVSVTWSAPSTDGGSAITTYELFASGTRVAKIPGRSYTIGGLTGGLTYGITVKACNLVGCSGESASASVITMPAAPTGVRASIGSASLTITWVGSASTGVTAHSLWYKASTTATWTEWTPGVSDSSGATITGLQNGTTYNVRVRAVAPQGATDSSIVIATPMDTPPVPVLSTSNISQSSLVLAWTIDALSGAVPTSYEVYRDGAKIATTTARFYSASNLTSLQEYSFTVKACNATGCSSESNTTTVTLPPPPPSRQAATAVGSKIVVTWLNSPIADYHSVWYKLSTDTTWTEWTPGESDTSPTELTDLPGGVTYNVRIGAHGTNGQAAYSPIVNVVPFAVPAAPYSLKQLTAGASSAIVTWIAPSNGGTAITGYKVFVDGGLYSEPAASATSVSFDNLEIGARYVVTIQACNVVGCSLASAALPIFTVPLSPTAVATTVGPTTATVTWTASTSTFVTGYKIFFRRTGTSTWVEFTPQNDDTSGTVVSSLLVLTPYELYVRAYNPKGFADSAIATFTTQNYQVPTEPTALTATAVNGGARLSWTAPSWNGAANISDYLIEWSSDNGATWTAVQRAISSLTNATVTGLTSGTNYRFRVSAKNIAGFSPPSAATTAVAPFSTASAPTAVVALAGDKEATVSWTAPSDNGSSAISDYVIQYSSNGGTYWSPVADGISTTASAVVGGLTNGTSYIFRVAAVNAAGQGTWSVASTAVTPIAPPSAPTKLTVFPGPSSVRLAWAVPSSTGGSAITDYTVQFSSDDGATWTSFTDGVSSLTSATVTGLTNGTVYTFRVAAVNALTSSDWSEVSLPASPRTLADAPTGLAGIAVDGKVSLSWNAPASTGGSPITDYQVQVSSNNGATWRVASDLLNPTTSALISNLTNGTTYVFKVAAVTAAGTGNFSAVSAAYTPRTAPGAPQYLLATVGDRQAQVSWKAPTSNGGAAITDYIVQYSSDDGANWLTFPDALGSALSTTVTGLTNGETYSFRVKAENIAGPGPFSTPTSLLLKSASQPPQNLTATAGDRSIALDWDVPVDDGGSAISSYAISYSSNNGLTWLSFSPTTDTAALITGLFNGTPYLVRVAAVTGFGVGLYATLPGPITPSTVPTAPTSVVGTYGDKSASLVWLAPSANGGTSVTDYLIRYSTDNGTTWTSITKAPSTQLSYTVTGLVNGTDYVFQIAAVNAVGNSAWSSSTPTVTPHAPASQPLSVTGTFGNASVALSWTLPVDDGGASITDYVIQTSTNGTTWATFADGTSTNAAASVTGLTNGTAYYLRVAAITVYGTGAWSATYGPVTPRTTPGAPTAIAGAFGDKQITVTWTAPASNGGSSITDYNVQYSSDSGATWTSVTRAASNSASQLVTGLTNGTSYVFRVNAVNAVGTGAWSSTSSSVVPRTAPGVPTALSGTFGDRSIALSWTAPADDGGGTITDYVIQTSTNGTTWTTFSDGTSSATTASVTGLTNGTAYYLRVATTTIYTTGSWSATYGPITPRTTPGAPTSVAGTFGDKQITVSWTAPASNGGSSITDYVVEFSSDNGANWLPVTRTASTTASQLVTGLANGVSYIFHVAAINAVGTSAWSANSSGVTPRTLPTAPTGLSGTYGNTSVALSWTAPTDDGGASITDYTIQYSSNSGSTWTSFTRTASSSTSATVTGLTNGTSYVFRLAAVNSVGTGAWSSTSSAVTPRTTPNAPTALSGAYGNTQVALSWTAPTSTGGAVITDYIVEYSTDAGATWTTFTDSESTSVTATVTGLTNGTPYVFHVAAVNDAGRGAWSSNSSAVIPRTTPGLATAVTGTYGNTSVALSWTAPTDNGGSAITNYLIQYSSNAGSSWSSFTRAASAATTASVTGLTNGTEYIFRVAAVNGVGTGSWSSESSGVTPRTLPGVPRNLLPAEDDQQVTLTWDAPLSDGGAAITDYVVQYTTNNGTSWTTFADGVASATGTVVTSLTNGTSYKFRVAAINSEGTGTYTAATSAVTPRSLPGDVTSLTATPGNVSVALSWTAPTDDGGSPITDYVVQTSTNGTTWTTFADGVSTTTSATVTGLTNGTLYYFRVATKNSAGPGGYVSVTATPRTVPGTPTAITAAAGYHSVDLDWVAPASNGGSAITDYTIQYSINSGTTWTTYSHTASATPSISVTGLTPDISTSFRVAAVNAAGQGSWSSTASATPTSTLGAPESVTGTYGDSSVALTWTAPYVPAETSLIDYIIQYSSDSGATWSTFADGTSSSAATTVTGLTNGTLYVFRVAAVNPDGTGVWSATSASVRPHITPDAPTAVTPTYGNAQVVVSWTAPASNGGLAITDYVVQFSSNAGSTWSTFSDGTSTSTSATVTGLTNGTGYVFRVAAVNDAQGSWSATSASATPRTTPGAPTALAGTFGNASVALTWTAPASNGGASITDYSIQYSTNGSVWTPFVDGTSTSTSATVTGLTNGTSYVFRVAALNSEGAGSWSSTSASVLPHTTPGAPTAVTPTYGNTLVTLSWTAPASNGGLAITDYVVHYSSDSGSTWSTWADGTSTATSTTVTGLTNGTGYVFRVAAVNDAQGSWSATSASATPRTTPGAPTALAGTFGNASVTLTWTAPSDNGGASITDYSVQFSSNSGSTWSTFADGTSTSTSATVTGLTNGTTYVFRVAALNSEGTGSWSSTSSSVLPHTTPGAPTAVTPTYGNAEVALSWTAPASNGGLAITDYVVQFSSNSGSSWSTFADGTSTATSTTVTGLTNGIGYIFRVAAVNDAQGSWSSNSVSATPRTVTNTPSNLSATASNAQVSLSWTAPSDNGGASITDYSIQYSSNSGSTWTTFSRAASTTTAATITGLTNGTTYLFRVAAINSEGTSSYTPNASATPQTTPGAPNITAATVSNNSSVSLTFSAPASDGGSAITSYTATCLGSDSSSPTATGSGSPLSVVVSNTGINYTCSVTATNGVGTSGASNTKTLSSTYVNPVYSCNSGDSPATTSSSTFQCTNAAYNNHPYWVSTYYYGSCGLGGWDYAIGNNANTLGYYNYTTNVFTSPYDGGSIVNTYRYWATSGVGNCSGQVVQWRWASTSCYSTSSGGTTGTCGVSGRNWRRMAIGSRSSWIECGGNPNPGNGYCYPNWPDSGYWASNWYYDYTYYNAPLISSGYWNGWTIT